MVWDSQVPKGEEENSLSFFVRHMSKRPHSNSELDESATKRRDTRHVESFSVRPAQHYAGRCAIYKQPVEINSYSIDGERCVWFDDRELVRVMRDPFIFCTKLTRTRFIALLYFLETIPSNTHRRDYAVPIHRFRTLRKARRYSCRASGYFVRCYNGRKTKKEGSRRPRHCKVSSKKRKMLLGLDMLTMVFASRSPGAVS